VIRLLPDCFSRGLLREALGQLAGLKRRKLALEMLGAAIQTGLDQQDNASKVGKLADSPQGQSHKRKLPVDGNQDDGQQSAEADEPTAKKMRTT